jgi:hypothetical protein
VRGIIVESLVALGIYRKTNTDDIVDATECTKAALSTESRGFGRLRGSDLRHRSYLLISAQRTKPGAFLPAQAARRKLTQV